MLLVADFKGNAKEYDLRFGKHAEINVSEIKKYKRYGVVDFDSGKLQGYKFGRTIMKEQIASDGREYANMSGDNAVESIGFYNPKLYDYKYITIDTSDLEVKFQNFDELNISIFKCNGRFWFRVDTWVWEITAFPTTNFNDLNASKLFGIEVGRCYLKWSASSKYSYMQRMILYIDCIMYDKVRHNISFRLSSKSYLMNECIQGNYGYGKTLSSNMCDIDLDSGKMHIGRVFGTLDSSGMNIDIFNRNMVFGG